MVPGGRVLVVGRRRGGGGEGGCRVAFGQMRSGGFAAGCGLGEADLIVVRRGPEWAWGGRGGGSGGVAGGAAGCVPGLRVLVVARRGLGVAVCNVKRCHEMS